jgi:GNAT superfamily N-acetyltransferase
MARTPPGFAVRQASSADNEALIKLELDSPVVLPGAEESCDRSPDFFACHRVQGIHRVMLAELRGRPVGFMAGLIQSPLIRGRARRLVYIQRARVHPDYQGLGIAWALANVLFAWSRTHGAEGPFYLIAPGNQRSVAFGGRAGRRWPVDVRLLGFDASGTRVSQAQKVAPDRLGDVVDLVNRTHAGEDFFEQLTVESLGERLSRDDSYRIEHLYGVMDGGQLAAVAGLWDKGAIAEQIRVDRATGLESRSRSTMVVDWGWSPGCENAFAGLLRFLAGESLALGRSSLTICEPRSGMVPDPGLPRRETGFSLYTPTIDPPTASALKGLFTDLLSL